MQSRVMSPASGLGTTCGRVQGPEGTYYDVDREARSLGFPTPATGTQRMMVRSSTRAACRRRGSDERRRTYSDDDSSSSAASSRRMPRGPERAAQNERLRLDAAEAAARAVARARAGRARAEPSRRISPRPRGRDPDLDRGGVVPPLPRARHGKPCDVFPAGCCCPPYRRGGGRPPLVYSCPSIPGGRDCGCRSSLSGAPTSSFAFRYLTASGGWRRRERFIATISHELRTRWRRSRAALTPPRELATGVRALLAVIVSQGLRLSRSRAVAPRPPRPRRGRVERRPVDVAAVVRAASTRPSNSAMRRCQVDVADELGSSSRGRGPHHQVLSPARQRIKYRRALHVRAEPTDGAVRISVADSARIPLPTAADLREFYRVDPALACAEREPPVPYLAREPSIAWLGGSTELRRARARRRRRVAARVSALPAHAAPVLQQLI